MPCLPGRNQLAYCLAQRPADCLWLFSIVFDVTIARSLPCMFLGGCRPQGSTAMSGPIRFDNGADYERMMGTWSRIVGEHFLDWVSPPRSLNWLDVGCGNGAFTELLMRRCMPASVVGVDPSPAQLDYARNRAGATGAEFHSGNAMDLQFETNRFDASVAACLPSALLRQFRGFREGRISGSSQP